MTEQDMQIERLIEALRAADYYISRMDRYIRRKRVTDMAEAMDYYNRLGPPLLEAYAKEEA